jgi:hypothetical protein
MSVEEWRNECAFQQIKKYLQNMHAIDTRVQMIHKLLKLIVETLDDMEAEGKVKSP